MEKKTILIVDDKTGSRRVLKVRLNANHYHTVIATDARQAMSRDLKRRLDAIRLDFGLSGGNGLVALQRLQAHTSLDCIPVIIVTAEVPQAIMRSNFRTVVYDSSLLQ